MTFIFRSACFITITTIPGTPAGYPLPYPCPTYQAFAQGLEELDRFLRSRTPDRKYLAYQPSRNSSRQSPKVDNTHDAQALRVV